MLKLTYDVMLSVCCKSWNGNFKSSI